VIIPGQGNCPHGATVCSACHKWS